MFKKRTQIVTHIMPSEIDEYSFMVDKLTESSEYLEKTDWISLYTTLNLSPQLTLWEESKFKPDFFIKKFNEIKEKASWANEIIFEIIQDDSILGTTAQKRKAIKGDYDQFIFLDCDISFHPVTLKYMLEASYGVNNEYYIITPQTVKLWDFSWDILTHNDFVNKPYGYQKYHNPNTTYKQTVDCVNLKVMEKNENETAGLLFTHKITGKKMFISYFRFACGWFTLYNKDILNYIGIPDWLGHYGPEDTYMMYVSNCMRFNNWDVYQYILDGIYISENYVSRDKKYNDKIKVNNLKDIFRKIAEDQLTYELNKIKDTIEYKNG